MCLQVIACATVAPRVPNGCRGRVINFTPPLLTAQQQELFLQRLSPEDLPYGVSTFEARRQYQKISPHLSFPVVQWLNEDGNVVHTGTVYPSLMTVQDIKTGADLVFFLFFSGEGLWGDRRPIFSG